MHSYVTMHCACQDTPPRSPPRGCEDAPEPKRLRAAFDAVASPDLPCPGLAMLSPSVLAMGPRVPDRLGLSDAIRPPCAAGPDPILTSVPLGGLLRDIRPLTVILDFRGCRLCLSPPSVLIVPRVASSNPCWNHHAAPPFIFLACIPAGLASACLQRSGPDSASPACSHSGHSHQCF